MSEALRLADELLDGMNDEHWNPLFAAAAVELRRLHTRNAELVEALRQIEALSLYSNEVGDARAIAHAATEKAAAIRSRK